MQNKRGSKQEGFKTSGATDEKNGSTSTWKLDNVAGRARAIPSHCSLVRPGEIRRN
jgi:hypothetical protein